jgi:hypothetical protein
MTERDSIAVIAGRDQPAGPREVSGVSGRDRADPVRTMLAWPDTSTSATTGNSGPSRHIP